MRKNSGYTLIEVVVVSALAALAISLIYTLYIHFSRSANTEDLEQQYYQKLTSLEGWVRQDLRSAVEVREEASGVFSIKTQSLDNQLNLNTREIVYWRDEGGRGVERHVKNTGEVKQFDFTGLVPEGESFIFRIK
jgi:prepilin-type N-terminal cleavage/methylation domain-containing protein